MMNFKRMKDWGEYFDTMITKRKGDKVKGMYRFILDCSKFPECPYNYRKLFLLLDLTIPPEERLRRVKEGLGFYANNTENIILIKRNYVKIGNGKIEYIYELFTFNPQQPEEFTKRLREKYISLKEGQKNN